MNTKKFGYIRVSSKDQNEARQLSAMLEQGIDERDIYIDKQSGKDFNREQYQTVKHQLREGDILYIHSLDRFGRNKNEIKKEWDEITREKKADIIVLDMPLLDTTKHKDSVGTLIADIVLQVLSWMAEEERNKITTRREEGVKVALENGVQFGRPKAEVTPEFIQAYKKWKEGEITATKAMEEVGVKRTTFYKLVKELESDWVDTGK
ncbi:recombinase family protein [Bacillus paranthracis]|uniref:recombinase family protein n=1 Tax=Bacillus paranthracis TaxID=2026186 RepID=UPI003A805B0A